MLERTSHRIERINELIQRELVTLIKREIKDARLQQITITDVLTSRDLSSAKVFYSVPVDQQKIVEPLFDKAGGFLRSRVAKNLNLRYTPKFKFIYDSAPNTGHKIDTLLSKMDQ